MNLASVTVTGAPTAEIFALYLSLYFCQQCLSLPFEEQLFCELGTHSALNAHFLGITAVWYMVRTTKSKRKHPKERSFLLWAVSISGVHHMQCYSNIWPDSGKHKHINKLFLMCTSSGHTLPSPLENTSLSSCILWKLDSAQAARETFGIHFLAKHLIQIPQCSRLLPTSNILKALVTSPAVWAGTTSTENVLEDKCTARTSVYKPIAWSRWAQPKAEQWDCPVPSLHSSNTQSKTLNLLEFARTNQSNRQLHFWGVFPMPKVIFYYAARFCEQCDVTIASLVWGQKHVCFLIYDSLSWISRFLLDSHLASVLCSELRRKWKDSKE